MNQNLCLKHFGKIEKSPSGEKTDGNSRIAERVSAEDEKKSKGSVRKISQ